MNFELYILNLLEYLQTLNFSEIGTIILGIFGFFWVFVSLWVAVDISYRTNNIFIRFIAFILILPLNVIGLVIYLVVRPQYFIEELYWMDLERRFLREETHMIEDCPVCGTQLAQNFIACPKCNNIVRRKCKSCDSILKVGWSICPYCGTDNSDTTIDSRNAIKDYKEEVRLERLAKRNYLERKIDEFILKDKSIKVSKNEEIKPGNLKEMYEQISDTSSEVRAEQKSKKLKFIKFDSYIGKINSVVQDFIDSLKFTFSNNKKKNEKSDKSKSKDNKKK